MSVARLLYCSTPFCKRRAIQSPSWSQCSSAIDIACRSMSQTRLERYLVIRKVSSFLVVSHTAEFLSTPIRRRMRDHRRSVPSPSVKPIPSCNHGLYTSWQAHWCPYACIAAVASFRRARMSLGKMSYYPNQCEPEISGTSRR